MTELDPRFKWIVATNTRGLSLSIWGVHESEENARAHLSEIKPQSRRVLLLHVVDSLPAKKRGDAS